MREEKISIAYLSATNAAYLGKANVERCNIMLHCAACFIPQHIYEGRHAALGGASLPAAPLLVPCFAFAFLSTWRTVSWDMESTKPILTTFSASSRRVQRVWPSG